MRDLWRWGGPLCPPGCLRSPHQPPEGSTTQATTGVWETGWAVQLVASLGGGGRLT